MGTSSHQPPTPLQPQLNLAPQLTPAGEEKDWHFELTNFANLVPIGSPTCLQQLIEQPSTLLPPIGGSSTQMLPPQQSARDDSAAAIEPEDIPTDDYPALPHVIVIYVVNPFTFGHEFRHPMMMRLSMLAITRYAAEPVSFRLNCLASGPSTLSAPACLCLAAFNCSWKSSESNRWAI